MIIVLIALILTCKKMGLGIVLECSKYTHSFIDSMSLILFFWRLLILLMPERPCLCKTSLTVHLSSLKWTRRWYSCVQLAVVWIGPAIWLNFVHDHEIAVPISWSPPMRPSIRQNVSWTVDNFAYIIKACLFSERWGSLIVRASSVEDLFPQNIKGGGVHCTWPIYRHSTCVKIALSPGPGDEASVNITRTVIYTSLIQSFYLVSTRVRQWHDWQVT